MKKKALSLLLALCMLLSLLPTTALAYTGTSSSATAIATYYKYELAASVTDLAIDGPYYGSGAQLQDGFTATQLTAMINSGSTNENGQYNGKYIYTGTKYSLVGITATYDGTEYDVGVALDKSKFTVEAYYSKTSGASMPESDVSASDDWYVVTISDTNAWTLSPTTMPLATTDGHKVTVTYGGKTADVQLNVKNYDITVDSPNGDVALKVDDKDVTSVPKNTVVTMTVAPDEGYTVSGVTANGANVALNNKSGTFKVINDVTLVVGYTAGKYAVTAGSTTNGSFTIKKSGDSAVASGTEVEAGQVLTVEATPSSNYILSNVSVVKTGEETTEVEMDGMSFTMPGYPVTVKVEFTQKTSQMKNLNAYLTHTNMTLPAGVYYLTANLTLNGDTATSYKGNGFKVASGAEVVIYLNGYRLSATGKNAGNGTNGADGADGSGNSNMPSKRTSSKNGAGGYAGILLPSNSTLIFVGAGNVTAQGGNGGNGGSGGSGGDGYAYAGIAGNWDDLSSGGGGGAGGTAGGGAGAGIGTNGTSGVSYSSDKLTAAAAGTLLFYQDGAGSITTSLTGGSGGTNGTANTETNHGNHASASYDYWPFGNDSASGGGGGGGGNGGAGGSGAGYGAGGQGGSAGTSGTSGGSTNSTTGASNGNPGSSGSEGSYGDAHSAADVYTLQGITVESKFSTIYDVDNADSTENENDSVLKNIATDKAVDVWAYYYKANTTNNGFTWDKALNGDYDTDANWRLWKLEPITTNTLVQSSGTDYVTFPMYNLAVTHASTNTSKSEIEDTDTATITATYAPVNHNVSKPGSDKTATDTVTIGKKQAVTNNMESGYAVVGGGDAVKFNDGKDPLNIAKTGATGFVKGAAYKFVNYANQAYKFENTAAGYSLGDLSNTGNKTYKVVYTPYNDYLYADSSTYTTAGNTILAADSNYAALKALEFKNAGLYTITETTARHNDKYTATGDTVATKETYNTTYFVVIQQADLKISNAIDTVTHNTTVQDHTFDREVIGQNGEKVQGQYTFASNNATSTQNTYCYGESWDDANAQNQSANKNTPDITGIAWEFNVKHTYNATVISDLEQNGPGDRNMNNYLDQNDGTQLSKYMGGNTTIGGTAIDGTTLKADRNTFYSGTNGELHYAASGVAVLKDNDHLTVQAKYEKDQKIAAGGAGSDSAKTTWTDLNSSDNVTGSITSVFAEDVAFGAKFSNPNFGFRVNKGDFVSGNAFGGTPVTTIPGTITVASGETNLFGKLVEGQQYKGDYYVVTVKNSSGVVKSWEYNDTNNVTPTTANVPVGSEYELDSNNTWDAFEAGTYTVYVDYIGLYYQNTTGASGREPGWSGTESFNWVTASKSFTLTIKPRNIAYKPMNDLYKVYDGTALLVKDTLSNGDVTGASAYIIDLTEGQTSNNQFSKGLSNAVATSFTAGSNESNLMYNFLQPTDGTKYTDSYHTNLKLELAGEYVTAGESATADANANGSKAVRVTASRLLDTADDQNYALVSVNNQALSGEVFVAQMYVTHDMTAAVKVRDTTPMRDVLNLHAKAYMPSGRTMSYGTDGYLASAVDFYKRELVDKNDVTKTTSVYPTSSPTSYDYDATYELVLNSNSEAYIAHTANNDGFKINGDTGAVTQVAKLTSNNTNPANFLKVTMTLKDFGNYVVVKQTVNTEQYPIDTFGQCAENTTENGNRNTTVYNKYYAVKGGVNIGTGASNDETLSHTILYYMAGNGDTFNLYLPINQLNKRSVASVFANAVGSAHDVTVGNEKYQYVTVYENGDSAEFTFTVPQDSYLEDVKIVALGTNDSVPAFKSIDTTKLVGKFSANTEGKISTTYDSKKCELTLELVGVNGVSGLATTTSLYFNNDVAADAGYSAYKLAKPNEQIGGSTYTFHFTTGESEMGTECKLVIVPVIKKFSPILEKTSYTSNVSVEKKVTDGALTFTGAKDDYVYVNYKTLWDTTAKDSTNAYGVIDMSYTAAGASSATTLTQQTLGANYKDQFNSFAINTKSYTSFFNPATLIPGTAVSVTLKVWRNGVVAYLQSSTDADAMDEVTFTWTVSPEDYYRLFKDDVVVFRSSNKMEANAELATKQKLDNILGYGMAAGNAFNSIATYVTNHKVSMTVADAAWSTQSNFNILTTYADTWYKVGGTRMTIDATAKTMSGLAKGDNLYPTCEYAKLQRDTVTNGNSVKTDLGYARVIFGQITLNNAFVYTNSASIGVAPYSTTSYTGATKTVYTDTNDLYWFDGWYKGDAVASSTVNGTITGVAATTDVYTIKEHVNYVTFKDGTTTIGYGILDTSKDAKVSTMNFAEVPFTATKPVVGTANSTAVKNMTFTGTNHYTKSGYTLNGWYKNSVTEANKVTDVASVAVAPANTFYLKSTYNGGSGAVVTTTTVTSTMPMLRKGNTGDAVKTLQTKLNALGYNCGAVDGVFGTNTYNALVKYQKAMGISVDGVVGKESWGKLGVTGTTVTVAATTSVTSTTTTSATSNMPMLRKGNTGDAVKTLQTKLNALGYNCGAVDGVFGTNTYNAVVKFQKDKGLRVDGVVGNQTWAKLG